MTTNAATQAALDAAGTRPIFIDAAGLAYQTVLGFPLDLGTATGVIVGDDDGYRVYLPEHGRLGDLIIAIRSEG